MRLLILACLCVLSATVGCTGGFSGGGSPSGTASSDPAKQLGAYGNSPITSLSVGNYTSCAIAYNRLYCWGDRASEFKKVLGSVRDPKQVVISDVNGAQRACVMSEKTVKCSDDTESRERDYKNLRQIAITAGQTCVMTEDRNVSCFGEDTRRWDSWISGVPTLEKPSSIAGSNGRICATDNTSKGTELKCWGWVNRGQNTIIGTDAGITNPKSISIAGSFCVSDESGIVCQPFQTTGEPRIKLAGVQSISQNWDFKKEGVLCAVAQGQLYCWSKGTRVRDSEIKAPPFKNLSSIAYTPSHYCATDDEGVKCWGDDPKWAAQVPKMLPSTQIPIAANSYDGNGANKCSVAWNLKSTNFVACSNQLRMSFYKVENVNDPKTFGMTRLGLDGSVLAFKNIESKESGYKSYDLKLQAENGETLTLERAKFDSTSSTLDLGYVVVNGNSGSCVGLVTGDAQSCVKQWRDSSPRSDNVEFSLSKFSFANGAAVNAGGCSLKAIGASDTERSTARFRVTSPGCVMNGVSYDEQDTVEYRLSDEKNYPALSVPLAK